jgi:L-ascorbate metabolism protein UlaG (beta-lactamase superfamily)
MGGRLEAATMSKGDLDPSFPPDPRVGKEGITLWWLGQASFALRKGGTLLLLDPYLSDTLAEKYRGQLFPHERMSPVPVDPATITGLAGVLCTHGHTDHMDPGTLRAVQASSDPVFVVPRAERDRAIDRGVPPARLIEINAGESVTAGGISIRAVPSAHEDLVQDADGSYFHLGYVLDVGGVRIYHSGDCVPYAGQADLLRDLDVHVALLPVNGRDTNRSGNGVPGNFHWYEAVQLCRDAGIPALVCHHWGMFGFNTVDPDQLRRDLSSAAGDLAWTVPRIGEPLLVSSGGHVRTTM